MQNFRPLSQKFSEISRFEKFEFLRFCLTLTRRNCHNSLNFWDKGRLEASYVEPCLSAFCSVCLPTRLPPRLPTCLPTCWPICLPTCLPICLPTCLPNCIRVCLYVCLPVNLPLCLPIQKVTLQPWGRVELLLFVCAFAFGRGVILIEICCCCAHKCSVDTHANNSVLVLTVLFYPLFMLCVHMYCKDQFNT